MRRRITVAIMVLVAATLVVTSVGSFFFIRRAGDQHRPTGAGRTGQGQRRDHLDRPHHHADRLPPRAEDHRQVPAPSPASMWCGLYPDGSIVGQLPSGITAAELDVPRLQQGQQTSGHTAGMLAYSAVPTTLPTVTAFVPVLVITRHINNPVNGLRYFVLVGAGVAGVAALVAAGLARQFTRPLVAAVQTTRRIAAGDLDATVPVGRHVDPEFAQLAESINAMGTNLVRARDQERQFLLSASPTSSARRSPPSAAMPMPSSTGPPTTRRARPRSSAPNPAGWSGWSRTCSTWPASTPIASPSTSRPSTRRRWPARWPTGSVPGPGSSGWSWPSTPDPSSRSGWRPTPTGSARSWPT